MDTYISIYKKRVLRRFPTIRHFLTSADGRVIFSCNIALPDDCGESPLISEVFCEEINGRTAARLKAEPNKEYRLICGNFVGGNNAIDKSCYLIDCDADVREQTREINAHEATLYLCGRLDAMKTPIIEIYKEQVSFSNESFAELCGYPQSVIHSMKLSNLVGTASKAFAKELETNGIFGETDEFVFHTHDGAAATALVSSVSVIGDSEYLIEFRDISGEKKLAHATESAEKLIGGLEDGTALFGADEAILWKNEAFSQITGHSGEETVGSLFGNNLGGTSVAELIKNSAFKCAEAKFEMTDPSGTARNVQFRAYPVGDELYAVVIKDISDFSKLEKTARSIKITDPSTGMWTSEYFTEQYNKTFKECKTRSAEISLLIIEIVNFDHILMSYGAVVAYNFMKIFSIRLADVCGGKEQICRIGEARFALYLADTGRDAAIEKIERILSGCDIPIVTNGHDIFAKTAVGAGTYPYNAITADELFNFSRRAIDVAKKSRRSAYALKPHNSLVLTVTEHKHTLEDDLLSALENNEFTAYFQPRATVSEHTVIGGEALMRWESPVQGTVSPGYFLELAREIGILPDLGYKIIQLVCENINIWNSKMKKPVIININLDHEQLVDDNFVPTVKALLSTYNVDPSQIEFEVSENEELTDTEKEEQIIRSLKEIGLSVSTDNYGAGIGSVAGFDINSNKRLTIERSIVNGLEYDVNSREKAKRIIALAESKGLAVLAKGVENESQLKILSELGCSYYQGYYLCKPIPAAEFGEYLEAE